MKLSLSRLNKLLSDTVLLLGALTLPLSLNAVVYPLSDVSWDNPEFVKWFTGTYAFNGQINPKISKEEQELFKAISSMMERNPMSAISAIEQYIAALPPEKSEYSAALDYTMGSLYLQLEDTPSAEMLYQKAIDKFGTFQRAYQNLGLTYVQSGRFQEALPLLIRAVELGGGSGTLWGLIGYCYLNEDRPSQSLYAYEQALLYQPDSKDWRLGKLNALLNSARRIEAIAMISDMLKEDPDNYDLWKQQANAYLGEGKSMEAAVNLELLARNAAGSGRTDLLLGDIYLNEGMSTLAFKAYDRAIGSGELSGDRMLRIAEDLSFRGAIEETSDFLKQLREKAMDGFTSKDELQLLNLEAKLALTMGKRDEAAEKLKDIITRDPLNGKALIGLGDYFKDTGEIEEAVLQYERAAKVSEVEFEALVSLGRLYVSQRNYKDAINALERANLISPKSYLADYIDQLKRALKSL